MPVWSKRRVLYVSSIKKQGTRFSVLTCSLVLIVVIKFENALLCTKSVFVIKINYTLLK